MTNNLVILCRELSNCYYYVQQRLLDDYYYHHGSPVQEQFLKYLTQQIDFDPLMRRLKEHQEKVNTRASEFTDKCYQELGISIEVNLNYTRVLETPIALNPTLKEELMQKVQPISDTYQRLHSVFNKYETKHSPSLIGSNWRLKSIFHDWKHTKNKQDQFVLPEDVVTEIINNYFLYLKFGGELNE